MFFIQFRQSAGLLVAVASVVGLACALTVGIGGYLREESTRGVRAALSDHSAADVAFRPALDLALNASKQDAQVRSAIAHTFAPSGVSTTVTRTVDSHVKLLTDPDSPDANPDNSEGAVAMSVPDFDKRAELVAGEFANGSTEVVVQQRAAKLLHLEVGDDVLLQGNPFRVSGLWAPIDHLDPRWYADQTVVSGINGDYGPFVINESAWSRLGLNPTVRWTVVPDVHEIDSQNLGQMADAWARIQDDWRGQVDDTRTLQVQARFVQTAKELGVWISGLAAVEPVIVILVGGSALVALWELARAIAAARRADTNLLWARGSSAFSVARAAAASTAVVALWGAFAGILAAAAVFLVLGIGPASWVSIGIPSLPTIVLIVVAAAVFAATHAFQSTDGGRAAKRRGPARRTQRIAGSGVVVLLSGAAALAVWQLRLYGSPLVAQPNGPGEADPLAVSAPALALGAGALLAVLGFPLVTAGLERVTRSARPVRFLAARMLRAGALLAAAQVVVVALAAGTVLIAASYSATWAQSFDESTSLRAGADLHVTSTGEGIDTDTIDRISDGGANAVAPLEIQPMSIGGKPGKIVGVTPQAIRDVAVSGGHAFDDEAAAASIGKLLPAPTLPTGTRTVRLVTEASGIVGAVGLEARVVDAFGVIRLVPFAADATQGSTPTDVERSFTGDVPAALTSAPGPLAIVALDFTFAADAVATSGTLEVKRVTASDGSTESDVPFVGFWIPDSLQPTPDGPASAAAGHGFVMYSGTPSVRMTQSLDGTINDDARPHILISRQLADTVGAKVGQIVSFTLQDSQTTTNATVERIVGVVPGSPSEVAVMMNLGVIQHYQLRYTEQPAPPRDLWIRTSDPGAVSTAIRPLLPADSRIAAARDVASRLVLGSASVALWAGAALCIVMAVIAVATTARAQSRSRRSDAGVFRALGLSSAGQGAMRLIELSVTIVVSMIAGVAVGLVVAALTVPQLARAAIPAPYRAIGTALAIDPVPLAVGLGALLVPLAVVALVERARSRRTARRAVPGEDA